jgi:hypothetical protein
VTKNSPYIEIKGDYSHRKEKLVEGLIGAILMYVGCLSISGYLLYRATRKRDYRQDERFLD